jgi:hypothetical protein
MNLHIKSIFFYKSFTKSNPKFFTTPYFSRESSQSKLKINTKCKSNLRISLAQKKKKGSGRISSCILARDLAECGFRSETHSHQHEFDRSDTPTLALSPVVQILPFRHRPDPSVPFRSCQRISLSLSLYDLPLSRCFGQKRKKEKERRRRKDGRKDERKKKGKGERIKRQD